MTLAWVAQQIRQAADRADLLPAPAPRFNPRPPGVIREGSATDEVLAILANFPNRYFTYGDLRGLLSERSHASMSWALLYLRRVGLVQVIGDGARNPQYLRYRFAKKQGD